MNTAEILHFQQKADTESGYMRIANSLQDKIIQFDFSKRQYKLIGAIMRKTFGYNKKKDIISRSQLAEMTGLDPSSISKATEELAAMKVIFKRQVRDSYEYEINTALNEWICPDQVGGDKTSPRDETPQGGVIKHPFTGDKTSPTKDNTKRQEIKDYCPPEVDETLHDGHVSLYLTHLEAIKKEKGAAARQLQDKAWDAFWQAYPRKEGKKPARVIWNRLPVDRDLYETIYTALKRQMKTPRWQDKEFIPHPKTWLYQERWNDELDASNGPADDVMAAYAGRMIKK